MKRREVFDKVKKHLLKQKKRAARPLPGGNGAVACRYRTEDGLRCAVGCLIPKRLYNPAAEGRSINSEEVRDMVRKAGVTLNDKTLNMLVELQGLHDGYEPEEWKDRLDVIEETYFE